MSRHDTLDTTRDGDNSRHEASTTKFLKRERAHRSSQTDGIRCHCLGNRLAIGRVVNARSWRATRRTGDISMITGKKRVSCRAIGIDHHAFVLARTCAGFSWSLRHHHTRRRVTPIITCRRPMMLPCTYATKFSPRSYVDKPDMPPGSHVTHSLSCACQHVRRRAMGRCFTLMQKLSASSPCLHAMLSKRLATDKVTLSPRLLGQETLTTAESSPHDISPSFLDANIYFLEI